jgi:hypothetical protein
MKIEGYKFVGTGKEYVIFSLQASFTEYEL